MAAATWKAREVALVQHSEWVSPRTHHSGHYQIGFLGAVGDLQKAGVLQDVVLEVEGRRFPCHRLVLSAASPYFRAMFTGHMAESRQKTVVLQGLHPDMLEEILSFMYSGTLHVSPDKLQSLYQAADLLQVDYVKEACTDYMKTYVEPSTCLDMYLFAHVFSESSVKSQCLQCICDNFTKVCTTAEFCSLSVNQLTEIIRKDELDVKEETTVWEAVVRWVEHSREDRQDHLASILPHVRFHLMTSDDMAAIMKHPLVREDPGSSEVIRTAVQMGTSDLKTRFGMDKQEMVMLFSNSSKEMLCMNPRIRKYISNSCPETMPPIIAATVTSDNNVYILAGEESDFATERSLQVYNHALNVWEHLSTICKDQYPPDSRLSYEFLVEVCGHLYYLAVIEPEHADMFMWVRKYSWHSNQWQGCSQPELGGGYNVRMAVSCGSHLYLLTTTEMHRYDPSNDRWCTLAPPIAKLHEAHATQIGSNTPAVIGTEIFCLTERYGEMLVYNTESDSWRELPAWGQPGTRSNNHQFMEASTFVLEGQLHVLFGYQNLTLPYPYHPGLDVGVGSMWSDQRWQMYEFDRSEGIWRDKEVNMPIGDWACCVPGSQVVQMNLAYLCQSRSNP